MKSNMQHDFAQTPSIKAPRSSFNRSHGHKWTQDTDWIIPFYWDDVLPGDTFNLRATIFARLNSPLFPIMDNMKLQTHFFFVPYRIIWDNSRKFFGEQTDPGDSIDYQIPTLSGTTASAGDGDLSTIGGRIGTLLNFIGLPHGVAPDDMKVDGLNIISALPLRAYSRIYSEWFRDQNLIDSTNLNTNDGPDAVSSTATRVMLEKRGKRFDYYTQALPWPQKGEAVNIPLGDTAPIIGIGTATRNFPSTSISVVETALPGQTPPAPTYGYASATNSTNFYIEGDAATSGTPQIFADLTAATNTTINDLREAFQVQKLLERDSRNGTRYPELLRNHFGVSFYDLSYRPEYLGGGSSNVNISPVAQQAQNQTTGTTDGTGVGDLAAMGTITANGHGFTKSFQEHGIVMGVCSIIADLTYQKGIRKELTKSTRYDIYWPSLAHLGEQSLLNQELFVSKSSVDQDVFGYIPRYDEYRFKSSQISGLFQSDAPSSLDAWHLSEDFSTLPTLGQTFIESNTPLDRCVQVPGEPHFIVDSLIQLKCARPLPTYGVPGMIDHF